MNKLLKSICVIALAVPALAGEITVVGKGSVSLPPDKMKMTFTVSALDLDIAVAKRRFKEYSATLAMTLAKVGVATNEILTSGMQMENVKEYENSSMVFKGFRFSEDYTFVARLDRARMERLYTSLVNSKCVEELAFWFELFDSEAPRQAARALAVENAREIADGIAKAAGVSLGEIEEITYDFADIYHPNRYLQNNCFAASDDRSITSAGSLRTLEISEKVRIKWKIK